MTIAGSAATSKVDRNSASRVALPAIWKAISTPHARVAAATADRLAEPAVGGEGLTLVRPSGPQMSHAGAPGATGQARSASRT